ncbi:Hint domain-containing protein [Streptomyces sp. NPDC001381]|uniref:Hint domain-containing protein n=1 Tax=Streptomyces sp. NPDC001381 TaxID=3364567 RepID=UPI0036996ED4
MPGARAIALVRSCRRLAQRFGQGGLGRRGGASCPINNSFTPDTKVLMADGSTKAIKDVKAGDKVLATDPETGETTVETVTAEIKGKGVKHLAQVTATDGHPFWAPELAEWIDATDLKSGGWLRTSAGTLVQITAVERWTALDATVHNLTVSMLHTYYVLAGASPVLVHNCGDAESTANWVEEGGDLSQQRYGMPSNAYEFQSGTSGARSAVDSRRALAPPLEMPAADGSVVTAKFDGVDGIEIIDRKTNPRFTEKAVDLARRQAAKAAYHGLTPVYEVPNATALAAMNRFMQYAK